MNGLRGFTTITLGGKSRPVKFGTNQTILFCHLRGCTLKDYTEIFKKERLNSYEVDGSEARDLMWSALKDGARFRGQEFENTPEDVADWLDEVDELEVKKMFASIVTPTVREDKKKVRIQKK
jgi:hypothetical protein